MGYISDMSSEAGPRSLPAVVVKAGFTERGAHARMAEGQSAFVLAERRGADDRAPRPLKDGVKKCMLSKCILHKDFKHVLCLSHPGELGASCPMPGWVSGGLGGAEAVHLDGCRVRVPSKLFHSSAVGRSLERPATAEFCTNNGG